MATASMEKKDWKLFTKKKNEVKKLLNQAREEYIKEKLQQDKQDPKKCWRSINSLTGLGRNKTKKGLNKIITHDGISLKGLDAANYMNEFYTNASSYLAANFGNTWSSKDCEVDQPPGFSFKFITEKSVIKLVKEIKISKSSATGTLTSHILKDAFQVRIIQEIYMLIFYYCVQIL